MFSLISIADRVAERLPEAIFGALQVAPRFSWKPRPEGFPWFDYTAPDEAFDTHYLWIGTVEITWASPLTCRARRASVSRT